MFLLLRFLLFHRSDTHFPCSLSAAWILDPGVDIGEKLENMGHSGANVGHGGSSRVIHLACEAVLFLFTQATVTIY